MIQTDLEREGAAARLLGGVAVALRCPIARPSGPLARAYSDLDYVTSRKGRRSLQAVLERHGFDPATRFNATNGQLRMMFDARSGVHVDVFVDRFVMCHTLDLRGRLEIEQVTLPIADLLLTKLQVAELTCKDVADVAALLHDHELSEDDAGINYEYFTRVLCADWGWWRTVTENLGIVETQLATLGLAEDGQTRVLTRVKQLGEAVAARTKSLKWRARAAVGDRVAWREIPEEARRA